jgi:hypothetical protein
VRRSFRDQLAATPDKSARDLGGIPSFVGEFGLPFDLDHGASFLTGDYASQSRALAAYYDALDANLLGATLWNYTADNTHENGDGWNSEDFSVYCQGHGDAGTPGEAGTAGDGGRAVAGFCRPYATRIPGVPSVMRYETGRRRFTLAYRADPAAYDNRSPGDDVEVFVPPHLARDGLAVRVSDGSWRHDAGSRTLLATPDPDLPVHEIVIEFRATPSRASRRHGARS